MTQHTITATRSGTFNGMDWDADYIITFSIGTGTLEFVSVRPEIGTLDHGAFTDLAQQDLDDWARDWLDENRHECAKMAGGRVDDLPEDLDGVEAWT